MKLLGIEGYKKIVNESMEKTRYLTKKAREYGFETAIDPVLNIVSIKDENKHETCAKLREDGWYVSVCRCVDALRIVVMPHIEIEHIDGFLECLSNTK